MAEVSESPAPRSVELTRGRPDGKPVLSIPVETPDHGSEAPDVTGLSRLATLPEWLVAAAEPDRLRTGLARAVQGLGAAILMALTVALVRETVPKEKTGSAMGLLGTMSAIGTALGP